MKENVSPLLDTHELFENTLTQNEATAMNDVVSEDEVKEGLFDIDDDKAPGPDGFTSKFFKVA
ncbi:hypothetical protein Tco_1567824, partial [Tanacetum coccineum]